MTREQLSSDNKYTLHKRSQTIRWYGTIPNLSIRRLPSRHNPPSSPKFAKICEEISERVQILNVTRTCIHCTNSYVERQMKFVAPPARV
jgi:hypothetical protein